MARTSSTTAGDPSLKAAGVEPGSLLPWVNGTFPPLPMPDQSRYGPGPDGPRARAVCERWHLRVFDDQGAELFDAILIGEADLLEELETYERREDFGCAIALPKSPVAPRDPRWRRQW